MNAVIAQVLVPLLQHLPRAEGDLDDSGNFTTTNWLIPEQAELIYGGIASAIIIAVLVWKAGPMARKAFRDRTERIEQELEESGAGSGAGGGQGEPGPHRPRRHRE